jgi:hypothetical protein
MGNNVTSFVFDDYDGLSRVTFDETTGERVRLSRPSTRHALDVVSIERLDPEYIRREIAYWRRYTKTMGIR